MISMCTNLRLVLNRIISIRKKEMKRFNCEETIVILVCKLVLTHLKIELPTNYVCKTIYRF